MNLFDGNFKLENQTYTKEDNLTVDSPQTVGVDLLKSMEPTIGKGPEEEKLSAPPIVDNETTVPSQPSTETEESFSFLPIIDYFGDKGIIKKGSDPYEDSEAGFEKALSDTLEARWKDKLDSLDDKRKEILGLLDQGLDPDKYTNYIDFSKLDISDHETQRNLTIDYLLDNGYSEEEAEQQTDLFEESGVLETQARLAARYLDKVQSDVLEAENSTSICPYLFLLT